MPEPPKKEEQPNNNTSKATGQTRGRKRSVAESLIKQSLGKDKANQSEDKQHQTDKNTKQEKSSELATKSDLSQDQTIKAKDDQIAQLLEKNAELNALLRELQTHNSQPEQQVSFGSIDEEESFEMDDLCFNTETFLYQVNTFMEELHKLDNSLSASEKRKKFTDMKFKLFPLIIKNFFFFAYTKSLLDLPSEQELRQINEEESKQVSVNVLSTAIEYTVGSVTNLVFALEELLFEKLGIRGLIHSLDVKTEVSYTPPFFKLSRAKPSKSMEKDFDLDNFLARIGQYRDKQNAHKILYKTPEQENASAQKKFMVVTNKALSFEDVSFDAQESTQPATDKPDLPQDQIIKTIETILSQSQISPEEQQSIFNKLLKKQGFAIIDRGIPDNKTTMKGAETGKVVAPVETAEAAQEQIEAICNTPESAELDIKHILETSKQQIQDIISKCPPKLKKALLLELFDSETLSLLGYDITKVFIEGNSDIVVAKELQFLTRHTANKIKSKLDETKKPKSKTNNLQIKASRKVGDFTYRQKVNNGKDLYWYIDFTSKSGKNVTAYYGTQEPTFNPAIDIKPRYLSLVPQEYFERLRK